MIMQTTLIITMAAIFLTWLYIQQKRLVAYEQYCMWRYKLLQHPKYIEAYNHLTVAMNQFGMSAKKAAEVSLKLKIQ